MAFLRTDATGESKVNLSFLSAEVITALLAVMLMAWIVPRPYQPFGVAAVTSLFLGYYAPLSLAILLLSAGITFGSTRYFKHRTSTTVMSIAVLVTVFLVAKSFQDFYTVDSGQQVVTLGLFFYVLRQIHYVVEHYKENLPPHTWSEYLCYLLFFPTILAGPINTFQEFRRDLHRRRFDVESISISLERIVYGYFKIVVVANWLVTSQLSQYLASFSTDHPALGAYLDCIRYGLNLYFQFSGYTDIAVGVSLAAGFRIIENFDHPYLAVNINDFWQRWHISLSRWCRDYVFMSVLSITRRPLLAIVSSMMAIGLWHELSPRYTVWALYHGCGIAVWHLFRHFSQDRPVWRPGWLRRLAVAGSMVFTLNFVILSFAITKSKTLHEALGVYSTILGIEK